MKLILLSFALCTTSMGVSVAGERIKNESAVTYRRNSSGEIDTYICSGAVPKGVNLEKIGVNVDGFKSGVVCAPGDFDGNGYLDFALYNNSKAKNQGLVIFFKKSKVIGTSDIFVGGEEIGSSFGK